MKPDLDFSSAEEFREVCRYLSGRLHFQNRVFLSESGFVWEVAQLLDRLGDTFARALDDPSITDAFGDGYRPAALDAEQRTARLLELLAQDGTA